MTDCRAATEYGYGPPEAPLVAVLPLLVDDLEGNVLVGRAGGDPGEGVLGTSGGQTRSLTTQTQTQT